MYSRQKMKDFLRERVARPASAGVIITNQADQALLLKAHYKTYWSFPGGWIEDGQTPILAALRELEEEAGITLQSEQLELAFMVNRSSEIMQTYQFIFKTSVQLETDDKIVMQASEIEDWKFVSRQDVTDDKEDYGGAVVAWAEDRTGYIEEVIKLTS